MRLLVLGAGMYVTGRGGSGPGALLAALCEASRSLPLRGAFVGRQAFSRRLSDMATRIRAMPALDPERPVMVPGDPEKSMMTRRQQVGIPMDRSKFDEFLAVSPRFARAVRP